MSSVLESSPFNWKLQETFPIEIGKCHQYCQDERKKEESSIDHNFSFLFPLALAMGKVFQMRSDSVGVW